ncbi:MAG: type II toxin-antitoxin system RelE/ParE family toxin [Chlorobiaceae bacterium]
MNYTVRYTQGAKADLLRLYDFLLEIDLQAAEQAMEAIKRSMLILKHSPFSCRKASAEQPFLRELLVAFGSGGYVALFEIDNNHTVTILAVRHQREDDYY